MKFGSDSVDIPLGSPEDVELTFPVVPEENRNQLPERHLLDHEDRMERFATWLLTEGKDTDEKEGYSKSVGKRTANRVNQFYRTVWDHHDRYVAVPTQDDADDFVEGLAYTDYSQSHKHATLHALKRFYKWRHTEHGATVWNPDKSFNVNNTQNPQDYLSKRERRKIRRAALDHGTLPNYPTVKNDPERRERLRPLVAERAGLDDPDDVGMAEWKDDLHSWKYTSMVWASLDAGLRPIEIENARADWVNRDEPKLMIPKEESAKNTENWSVPVLEKTHRALLEWLHEREHRPRYDNTDKLWVTRYGNTYGSKELGRLLRKLCDKTEIEYENRPISWYSIRHSVGTLMTKERDLAATQAQLRHKRPETTMKYDGAPEGQRRDALDKMG
jgi:site-specific recombinase XerD